MSDTDTGPVKYRKKPVVIEAMRLHAETDPEVFLDPNTKAHAEIDWVIKGVAGEFYPCKPDIFAATYERAS